MNTLWIVVLLIAVGVWFFMKGRDVPVVQPQKPQVVVVQQPPQQQLRPDIYPEPVQRLGFGLATRPTRTPRPGPYQQVGILTAEGGSSGSAAPDRTIIPLYGREIDARRGRWNYYTRTDGNNPVQVPVRVQNRVCDDDTNGCFEVSNDDSIHVPALGRSFKATVYKKSIFG
jgi:hypothetical protein